MMLRFTFNSLFSGFCSGFLYIFITMKARRSSLQTVTVFLPTHCSSLTNLSSSQTNGIVIYCADAGVAWREIHPLLLTSPKRIGKKAAEILVSAFGTAHRESTHIHSPEHSEFEKKCENLTPASSHWDQRAFSNINCPGRRYKKHQTLILLVVPPMLVPPRDLHAERFFTSALVRWENRFIQIKSLSAFLATMGGGYFLCRYVGIAANLAQQQRSLALSIGDYQAADRCTISEAYNYIHAGIFGKALLLLKSVQTSATIRKDQGTLTTCGGAMLFCKRVRRAAKYEHDLPSSVYDDHIIKSDRENEPKGKSRIKQATVDDYQRIRIVGDPTRWSSSSVVRSSRAI